MNLLLRRSRIIGGCCLRVCPVETQRRQKLGAYCTATCVDHHASCQSVQLHGQLLWKLRRHLQQSLTRAGTTAAPHRQRDETDPFEAGGDVSPIVRVESPSASFPYALEQAKQARSPRPR